jgi:hypothetical protein
MRFIVDDDFLSRVVFNFKAGVIDRTYLRWGHPDIDLFGFEIGDEAKRNVGHVEDLVITDRGLEALIFSDDQGAIDTMTPPSRSGVSVGIRPVTEPRTGDSIWPVLDHVALVSVPYLKGMKEFQTVEEVAAADRETDKRPMMIFMDRSTVQKRPDAGDTKQEGDSAMTKEQIIAALMSDHGINVPEIQRAVETLTTEKRELSSQLADIRRALEISDPNGDAIAAVNALVKDRDGLKATLSERDKADRKRQAEALVASLLSDAKITKAQEPEVLKMAMADPASVELIFKDAKPVIDTEEHGKSPQGSEPQDAEMSDEAASSTAKRIIVDAKKSRERQSTGSAASAK